MIPTPGLPIRAQWLTLRAFVPEDAARLLAMSREPGMRMWLPDQVYEDEPHAREVVQYLISCYRDPGTPAAGPYVLGVCLDATSELIGHVGLSPLQGGVEIGFAIASGYQGRGLATEAVTAAAQWGMRRFGLDCIIGVASRDNVASCRVLQGAGFSLVDETLRSLHGRSGVVRTYRVARSEVLSAATPEPG
jgi:ribosomal-protein-alanine N-acetyltransferase